MPKKYLLTGPEIRSFRPLNRAHGTFFSLSYGPLEGADAKCAVVVSKKVAIKATDRNLIKRRARGVLLPLMGKAAPAGVILTAKKGAKEASFQDLSEDVRRLFAKVPFR